MAISNPDIKKKIRELDKGIQDSTNNLEEHLLHQEEEPNISSASFELARVQTLYVELRNLLINQGVLNNKG